MPSEKPYSWPRPRRTHDARPFFEVTVTITARDRRAAQAIRDDIAQLIADSCDSGAYDDADVATGGLR